MTITLALQTETKLREWADREGQDVTALVDMLLAASVEAAERDFEEACAAIASSLTSDPQLDISIEDYQAQFKMQREARRLNHSGRTSDLAA